MRENEARTAQSKTNDDEATTENQSKSITRSSKPYQGNGSEYERKYPTRELKLCIE
jgi:hypothetical protein